jgi:FAD/FMN-containing dehydrogenase
MLRRDFLGGVAAAALYRIARPDSAAAAAPSSSGLRRVRPSDPAWPSPSAWNDLSRRVGGRLIKVESPLDACRNVAEARRCLDVFKELKNPYYVGDNVALTQTCGWLDAWTAQPSAYAVAAQQTSDVVAAVNFARENNLRLVTKGGGHSYLGTSNAPDSLMIWTRAMNRITLHDAFVGQDCEGQQAPTHAVTIGPGVIWLQAYNEVTTKAGRYVQGGGCATVGVAGLVLGGGFGSYSKNFGTAAASLLEAEVVTADGAVRIANACTNPDLFWALKGGGGGTFGIVTRVTLQTHELPGVFGFAAMTIRASSDGAFRRLLDRFVSFYADSLHNRHWGEIVNVKPKNILDVQMSFQGLDHEQANRLWQPFLKWIDDGGRDFAFTAPTRIVAIPAQRRWDADFIRSRAPAAIVTDDRPGAPNSNIFWSANLSEAGHFMHAYSSVWLPEALLTKELRTKLVDALISAARHSTVELHFHKGLAGGADEAIGATRETSINPAVTEAFALAIVGSEGPPAFPGLPGHEPAMKSARENARHVAQARQELARIAPDGFSYVAESDYFISDWQRAYWGSNYLKLLAIKKKYDPDGLFFVRHGVGSEAWSDDGFTRTT